jgi:hypothetical protein
VEIEYTKPTAPNPDAAKPRYGNPDELRKIRRMIRSLATAGFFPHSIALRSEGLYIKTPTERAAVNEIGEWDDYITLRFTRGADESRLFGVLLVQGNGEDIVSDYTSDASPATTLPPPGTFSEAMDKWYMTEETREV